MRWFFQTTKIKKFNGLYWLLPCIEFRYDNYHFLETGVETPAFIFRVSFLNFSWGITIQQGY